MTRNDPTAAGPRSTSARGASATVQLAGREYLTQEGLAARLGVTVRTLARWEERRVGPPRIRIGRLVLYDLGKLPEWLETHETGPVPRRAAVAEGGRR